MKGILIAVILDLIIGDPYSFPHPVKLMGRLISLEEKLVRKIHWRRQGRISNLKIGGLLIVIINIIIAFTIPYLLLKTIEEYKVLHSIINIYLIYTCIAARSLDKEAMKVYYGLDKGIEEARFKLSYIVGRDTKNLSEEEIIRAAIETVGENTADGVIAPLFYIMLLGAPGGFMYKMVNTMDSMLGYKNEKYMELGFFPAKVDDVYNYIPARLTGVLICLSSIFRFNVKNGFRIMIRDRNNHKSPNAAYPEGAVAGLLNIQLGGNSYYFGKIVEKPTIGDRIRNIQRQDIKKTIEIMYRTEVLLLVIYGLINILLGR
ncbi:adenosylcobinamide-phosphate synthase CbiB [Schnuerera ultunensis]|uniref:adenosylcobinamide-phosphate synthase CbiB n=1 Tax=Schnuerera ultunensis TaxID=45497 RepID=UPI000402A3C9|nr:adenosylcobinamide-phosphate synthase CbiB [Schnuerera ultunensis]